MQGRPVVSLACLALLACSDGGVSPSPGGPVPTTGAITVANASSRTITHVFVEPSPATVLATPRNAAPLAPGASILVDGLAPGTWDVFTDVHGTEDTFWADLYDTPLAAGETLGFSPADDDFTGSVKVTNGGATNITAIWLIGDYDCLDAPLAPGATALLNCIFPAGTYPLRCDFYGGGSFSTNYVIQPFVVTAVTCG